MKNFRYCFLLFSFYFTAANADVISDFCKERILLANYRNEVKVKCPISDDLNIIERDVWSLKILNKGIKIRKQYAAFLGHSYTTIHITNDIKDLFVMGDEGPWIKETVRLENALSKGL